MEQKYHLDDKVIKTISDKFGITVNKVKSLIKFFNQLRDHEEFGFDYQHLSHFVKSVEKLYREQYKNKRFIIDYIKLPEGDTVNKNASALYYPNKQFIIFIREVDDILNQRAHLAHELGHLFVNLLIGEININKEEDIKKVTEPYSSIFGLLCLIDKNYFYQNTVGQLVYGNEYDIIEKYCGIIIRE